MELQSSEWTKNKKKEKKELRNSIIHRTNLHQTTSPNQEFFYNLKKLKKKLHDSLSKTVHSDIMASKTRTHKHVATLNKNVRLWQLIKPWKGRLRGEQRKKKKTFFFNNLEENKR